MSPKHDTGEALTEHLAVEICAERAQRAAGVRASPRREARVRAFRW
jgi:hypothetical protein